MMGFCMFRHPKLSGGCPLEHFVHTSSWIYAIKYFLLSPVFTQALLLTAFTCLYFHSDHECSVLWPSCIRLDFTWFSLSFHSAVPFHNIHTKLETCFRGLFHLVRFIFYSNNWGEFSLQPPLSVCTQRKSVSF